MTLLEQFAATYAAVCEFKVERERIHGVYGHIVEYNGKLWVWTHSHAPNGHEFFPINDHHDEFKAINLMKGLELIIYK
jgi:hypothetical protein